MNTYLVGGAVRDKLLELEVTDRDWVVVGATPDEMLHQGYQQVGRDFPVFLHPKTHEEYALARTERKTGHGYTGFETRFSPDVTLEQDLQRRDLTINAIACDEQGNFIDPYHGIDDIRQRRLRHVSDAFCEDPLRVLRVARFDARFARLGFCIADETLALMRHMVKSGELAWLRPERIWKETEKALQTNNPERYFQTLRNCGALAILFPEIDALFGVPAPAKWHPEIDTGIHTLMTLAVAAQLSKEVDIRFAALCHDVGKGITPPEKWPAHPGHGPAGVPLVSALCQRLRTPNSTRELAVLAAEYHDLLHSIEKQSAETLIALFDHLDAWRKPQRVDQLALISEADARGRSGHQNQAYPQGKGFKKLFRTAQNVSVKEVIEAGFRQQAIRQELTRRRIATLQASINGSVT